MCVGGGRGGGVGGGGGLSFLTTDIEYRAIAKELLKTGFGGKPFWNIW